MKVVSLFAGIGGFDLAFSRLGHEIVYANEWDKYSALTYEKNFGAKPDTRDIRSVPSSDIPDHDILVGGFPCQAFSIAGKRHGFQDTRGTLFFEIARLLADKRPRYFLLENVKGLLSHDGGKTIQTIFRVLTNLGYEFEWQICNSKDFGVPQNRERIFIVGHLRGKPRPKVFSFRNNDQTPADEGYEQRCANTLTGRSAGGQNRRGNYIAQINTPKHSNDRVYSTDGISPTLNTMQGGRRQPKISIPVLTPGRIKKSQNGRRFKNDGDPSFTLTIQDRHGVYDGMKIRRLTPIECERLQGFPDRWTEGVSDTQRYKQLGNAVTVNVVEHIAKKIFAADFSAS